MDSLSLGWENHRDFIVFYERKRWENERLDERGSNIGEG